MSEKKPAGYAAVKTEPVPDAQDGFDEVKFARRDKRIKILRIVQSLLSALLSIAIAVFQGRVYWTYQNTKDQPGAWPTVPDVVPTLLLFSVSIAALVFDICMIVAYLRPKSKYTPWAIRIGGAAHYVVASAKTVSYGISAVISKTSFDFGNASGQNADLWSYTCTDPAAEIQPIQAESNCNSQVSFPLSLLSGVFLYGVGLRVYCFVVGGLVVRDMSAWAGAVRLGHLHFGAAAVGEAEPSGCG